MPSRGRVQRLIRDIEAAFGDEAPPPYDRGLDRLSPEDRGPFRRRRWQDIVSPKLPYDGVFFFGDRAFRYYLPAYLVTALRWPSRAGNLRSAAISSLVAPGPSDTELAEFRVRMDAFTPAQKRVVREFLLAEQERDPIDREVSRALRRYWKTAEE